MTHRFKLAILIIFLLTTVGCSRGPKLDGFLWYGDDSRIALFDLKERTVRYPGILAGCNEGTADPLGQNYSFVCRKDGTSVIRTFSLSREELEPTSARLEGQITDPMLSPDGTRTLFRVRRSGDVFDAHLQFKDAGFGLLAKRIGAACFGRDNRTVYFAQESMVAAHVMEDITQPEKMPEGGLRALVTTKGAVRDLDYSLAASKLVICAGTKVLTSDLTGKNVRVCFDSTDAKIAGPLQMPFRARWSPDGTRIAILISPDGNLGKFVVLEADTEKRVLVKGPAPRVGGFVWTETYPVGLR